MHSFHNSSSCAQDELGHQTPGCGRTSALGLARRTVLLVVLLAVLLLAPMLLIGCGGDEEGDAGGGKPPSASRGGPPGGFGGPSQGQGAAIPVEVAVVERRGIADYLETNGTLEAENEVDIVARTSGPIVELLTEEGRFVSKGQVLARIDPDPIQADLDVAKVNLEEARIAFDRAQTSWDNQIISREAFDTAKARFDSARAQIESIELQLSYTEIRAPFSGLIVERAVKFAEFINNNQKLFRISDFDPLLCPIQIPEKDLPRVRVGQPAYVTVEAFPDQPFVARILRVSPVVDAGTGTFKVTLSVSAAGKLRPGMFASVFVEVDRRNDALVVPRRSLVLESIGDTVYVMADGVAKRREVQLGYDESDVVEVTAGLSEGERVVVVGQDAVSDGTPIYLVSEGIPERAGAAGAGGGPPGMPGSGGGDGPPSEEQITQMRKRMKDRGMSDEQIDAIVERMKSGQGGPPAGARRPEGSAPLSQPEADSDSAGADEGATAPQPGPGAAAGEARPGFGGPSEAGRGGPFGPDFDPAEMSEEQEQQIRQRMKDRGLSDEQIDERIKGMKSGQLPGRGRPGGPPGEARREGSAGSTSDLR